MKKLALIVSVCICAIVCASFTPASNSGKIEDCYYITADGKKIPLYGRVQIVEHYPDIKVQIVGYYPDIKVQLVEHYPDDCGKWQLVEHYPDFKVQIVEHYPDIKVQFVEYYPGVQ